jgi:hypothetical protein
MADSVWDAVKVNMSTSKPYAPWLILVSRLALFALVQALIAGIFWLAGIPNAWEESARWWIFSATVTNVISILLLNWLFRQEGKRFRDLFRFHRETFWVDLALSVGVFLLAGPIASLPSTAIAERLFNSSDEAVGLMFRPLPTWAVLTGALFPLTIGFAELPTYFGYVMPRLAKQTGSGWLAWALASLFLSLQHITLPLILDPRFILWRALMFLAFAFYVGLVIKLRPRLLPFMVIVHILIDFLTLSVYLIL